MKKILLIVALLFVVADFAFSDEEKEIKFPQRGVLASSIDAGNVNVKIPEMWGEGKNSKPPIQATVIKKNDMLWNLVAKNISSERYIFSLELMQFSKDGKKIKNTIHSFSLKPKSSKTVPVVANSFTKDYIVNIISWKKIDTKNKETIKGISKEDDNTKLRGDIEEKNAPRPDYHSVF